MNIRTTRSTVSFSRPFLLAGIDDAQPAGTYVVETDEELLQATSVSAYHRISTLMRLPPRPGSNELARVIDLDPLELSTLLASDAAPEKTPAVFPSRVAVAPQPKVAVEPRQTKTAAAPFSATGWTARWRSWLALNANELAWTALLGGGVLFTAVFSDR